MVAKLGSAAHSTPARRSPSTTVPINRLDQLVAADRDIDTLMGFSEGGEVIGRWMRIQTQRDQIVPELSRRTQIRGVLLIQPGFNRLGDPELNADEFPGTTIVTRNATRAAAGGVYGTVDGAFNFGDDSCGSGLSHCNYDKENPAGTVLDVTLVTMFGGGLRPGN